MERQSNRHRLIKIWLKYELLAKGKGATLPPPLDFLFYFIFEEVLEHHSALNGSFTMGANSKG